MNVTFILFTLLLLLMIIVGGKRGFKSFFTLCVNFLMLFIIILLMAYNVNPIVVTVIGCAVISSITLFNISGINSKTIASLISISIVVLLTVFIIYHLGYNAHIQGFSDEEAEAIGSYSLFIHNNFVITTICVILLSFIGAIIDVSISISSAMNELYKNNPKITMKELYRSGINIGKDIIGTMTNTLFFAYISSFMTLIIWTESLKYSFHEIINSKVFCNEFIQILCSGIGIVLIIPVTSLIATYMLKNKIGSDTSE